MADDRDLIAWKDKDGVTHVDHQQPEPDPIPRAHNTISRMFETLERLGVIPPREPELTPEYLITQARYFHTAATEQVPRYQPDTLDPALMQLIIAVDYLIQLEEARAQHKWIH